MFKCILILLAALCLSACMTNSNDAYKALDNLGFTNIRITGYKWFACSGDDWYHTGFIATNLQGKEVSGTVCSGLLFKNSTVRFD